MLSRVVVVIPTYNERENIEALVAKVKEALDTAGLQSHIVVVDDNSPDGTGDLFEEMSFRDGSLHLLTRVKKLGIGSAYIHGFRWVVENLDPDIIVQMDADFQHPPEMVPVLVEAVEKGFDVAVGSRYVFGGGVTGWGWRRMFVSRAANMLAQIFLGLSVKDVTSGFRAFNDDAVKALLCRDVSSRSYPYQVEVLHIFSCMKLKIYEVPYIFGARKAGRSKLSTGDIFRFLGIVLKLSLLRSG